MMAREGSHNSWQSEKVRPKQASSRSRVWKFMYDTAHNRKETIEIYSPVSARKQTGPAVWSSELQLSETGFWHLIATTAGEIAGHAAHGVLLCVAILSAACCAFSNPLQISTACSPGSYQASLFQPCIGPEYCAAGLSTVKQSFKRHRGDPRLFRHVTPLFAVQLLQPRLGAGTKRHVLWHVMRDGQAVAEH
jgi:hypothetical protein